MGVPSIQPYPPEAITVPCLLMALALLTRFIQCHALQQPSETFHHRPLRNAKQQVRLLRWDPTYKSSALSFLISDHDLALLDTINCKYTAVSYTWQEPEVYGRQGSYRRRILLNGALFEISENLWNFFISSAGQKVRKSGTFFFVDALCIDQLSEYEKECQIPLMSEIYNKSIRTIVWLGNSLQHKGSVTDGQRSPSLPRQLSPHRLCHLTENVYWSRTWVVSELLLSGNVEVCFDDVMIPWSDIASVTNWDEIIQRTVEKRTINTRAMARLVSAKRQWDSLRSGFNRRSLWRPPLHYFLREFSHNECTNEKDKVYAFLPLVDKAVSAAITTYYSPSATTFDLLCQVVDHVLSELQQAGTPKEELEEEARHLCTIWKLSGHDQERAGIFISDKLETIFAP